MSLAFEILYLASLLALSALGFYRYRLCWLYLKTRPVRRADTLPPPPSPLPSVTVQLPVYNEVYVIERLIDAVCAMDYPRDRLQIQVLDDSTDETATVAEAAVGRKKSEGFAISHIRRPERRGYKAGALKDAAPSARGEFIALFDADFVPPRDFLLRALGCFSDPSVGIAQARWGHTNRRQSLLTRLQGVFLDGHFLIEQAGRSAAGVFLNFNGTATVIRRSCAEEAGGWHDDTVAEDLDLSCRAQMAGWKIRYLPGLVCPAELPSGIEGFKSQQRRWAMGGVQNAKKFLRAILSRKDLPAGFKTEAAFHMLGNLSSPLFLTVILSAAVVDALGGTVPAAIYGVAGQLGFVASGGIFAFYLLAALEPQGGEPHDGKPQGVDPRGGESAAGMFFLVPLTMVLWAGMSVSNTAGVARAVFSGPGGEFVRTPKTATAPVSAHPAGLYAPRFGSSVIFELALAAALAVFAVRAPGGEPFLKTLLFVFSAAFLFVSLLSVKQRFEKTVP